MYDVLYHDSSNREQLLATGLGREAACALARAEARRRHVGRMFLAGSAPGPHTAVILIVESPRQVA